MSDKEIDIEKDHLVVFRKEGVFSHFRWYIDKDRIELEKAIACHNGKDPGYTAERSDDRLVREICAYREHASPFENVAGNAKEAREWIDGAVENLESALSYLRDIRDLE
jgi:hypothetical protein